MCISLVFIKYLLISVVIVFMWMYFIGAKRRTSEANGKAKQVTNEVFKFKPGKAAVAGTIAAEYCLTVHVLFS